MRVARRGCLALFLLLLVIGSTAAGGVAAVEPPDSQPSLASSDTAATGQSSDDTVVQTQTYGLVPDAPGEVSATMRYEIPDRVVELETEVPESATVTRAKGFSRADGTTYEWDEESATATIEFTINPNQTAQKRGIEAADGDLIAVDTGEWALFPRYRTPISWRYSGSEDDPVRFDRRIETAGPGAAGDRLVYLGAVETVERTANGQTFRLVVPKQADLAEPRGEILDSLADASGRLRVGARDETVVAIAAPTDGVAWGVRGLELGGSEFWVRDTETLDTAENVWLHEYVHTRQSVSTTAETDWLVEGLSVYYAALLTLDQERIEFREFQRLLAEGERSVYDDVVLSDESTWTDDADYVKGALAAGRIDESIRSETDSESSLQQVVGDLNAQSGSVTQDDFLAAVGRAGGQTSRAAAAEYTVRLTPLSMWSQATHRDVFGPIPAAVGYESAGYRTDGPYRNASFTDRSIRLAAGERLVADVRVTNAGDAEGRYNATLGVDEEPVASSTGSIGPRTNRTVPVPTTFAEPGSYTVTVHGDAVPVVVELPAEPRVESVSVDEERVGQGDSVTVTATVRNDAAIPANGTVDFTRNGETVAQRPVALEPGATTQVTANVSMPDLGAVRLGAGAADPVEVTVLPIGGSGPGFTVGLTILAIALALALRRR